MLDLDRRTNSNGYGQIKDGKGMVYAHRYAYELLVGPIPPGTELDHLCRVRHCVNPAHLEAVAHRDNLLRGDTIPGRNARKTECPRGHLFEAENTYRDTLGRRKCRECARLRRSPIERMT
jgi:hypothetical protein